VVLLRPSARSASPSERGQPSLPSTGPSPQRGEVQPSDMSGRRRNNRRAGRRICAGSVGIKLAPRALASSSETDQAKRITCCLQRLRAERRQTCLVESLVALRQGKSISLVILARSASGRRSKLRWTTRYFAAERRTPLKRAQYRLGGATLGCDCHKTQSARFGKRFQRRKPRLEFASEFTNIVQSRGLQSRRLLIFLKFVEFQPMSTKARRRVRFVPVRSALGPSTTGRASLVTTISCVAHPEAGQSNSTSDGSDSTSDDRIEFPDHAALATFRRDPQSIW